MTFELNDHLIYTFGMLVRRSRSQSKCDLEWRHFLGRLRVGERRGVDEQTAGVQLEEAGCAALLHGLCSVRVGGDGS